LVNIDKIIEDRPATIERYFPSTQDLHGFISELQKSIGVLYANGCNDIVVKIYKIRDKEEHSDSSLFSGEEQKDIKIALKNHKTYLINQAEKRIEVQLQFIEVVNL
jgi:hypothetical protein